MIGNINAVILTLSFFQNLLLTNNMSVIYGESKETNLMTAFSICVLRNAEQNARIVCQKIYLDMFSVNIVFIEYIISLL